MKHCITTNEVINMPEFEKMYLLLFNAITDALRLLTEGQVEPAIIVLGEAQLKTEQMYLEASKEWP